MNKQIGFVGLGKMGLNMVYKLIDEGFEVHTWNRSEPPRLEAKQAGCKVYSSLSEMMGNLQGENRIIWSMISAGSAVDEVLAQLKPLFKKGDIFVDGVNSYYIDSIRRSVELSELGVHFFDAGVSGGVNGARKGSCIMVGGNKEVFSNFLEDAVKALAVENGYGYFGEVGAGHFVKMVHNAIEYAMMQAIAEGMNLIDKSEYKDLDMEELMNVWNHGSIISGNLVGFLQAALAKDPGLESADSEIGSLGTGEWAVKEALKRGVPFTNIAYSVFARFNSRGQDDFASRVIQALRAEFGGHDSKERPEGNTLNVER